MRFWHNLLIVDLIHFLDFLFYSTLVFVSVDYNRVIVDFDYPDDDSSYINASYITVSYDYVMQDWAPKSECFVQDFNGDKFVIGSQAPLTNTLQDFWHMCWSNNVSCIAMLCDFVENGRASHFICQLIPFFVELRQLVASEILWQATFRNFGRNW